MKDRTNFSLLKIINRKNIPFSENDNLLKYKRLKTNEPKKLFKLSKKNIILLVILSFLIFCLFILFHIYLLPKIKFRIKIFKIKNKIKKRIYQEEEKYLIKEYLDIDNTDRQKVVSYIELCQKQISLDNKKYKLSNNPKISIVIPTYNRLLTIKPCLISVQNQELKDIEIIICDDDSQDGTPEFVELLQKEEERIVLIKHEKNVGTLKNRNDGVLLSKGEYILFLDSDDFLLPGILNTTYYLAKNNNYDILKYGILIAKHNISEWRYFTGGKIQNPVFQPKLGNYMFYKYGVIAQSDFTLSGKLIRRESYMEAIKHIDKYYLDQHMILGEDGLILFMIYKYSNSFYSIDDYGYFYFKTLRTTTYRMLKKKQANKTTRDVCLHMKFIFQYTNNTVFEKKIAMWKYKQLYYESAIAFAKMTEGFDFFYNVTNLYLNCDKISEDDKQILLNITNTVKNREKNITESIK